MATATYQLMAMSLAMPPMAAGHPNKMPFKGTLTRVGVPSDAAPSGSNGKRVLITAEAAERALPSLMGMAVNIVNSGKFDGHAPQSKIGFIHSATVVESELLIAGDIWAADFPRESLRIHLDQSQLGFSFEARNIETEDANADPVVITDLFFTGAAILMKDKAAYRSTRLAALAAMKHETESESLDMTPEDMKASLTEVVAGALAPVTVQLTALQAAQAAMELKIANFSLAMEAQQERVAKVEPAAASLEKTAQAMEAAGVTDQAEAFRRMAVTMRADAAAGRASQPFQAPVAQVQATAQPVAPKFEDSEGYKTMAASVAALTQQLATTSDKLSATETKMADLKATADLAKSAPDRKTLPPHIGHLMAKTGLELPEDGRTMSVAALDASMKAASMTIEQRMKLKNGLASQGHIPLNSNTAV